MERSAILINAEFENAYLISNSSYGYDQLRLKVSSNNII